MLVNISDHLVRHSYTGQEGPPIGILLGSQSGLSINVLDSVEAKYKLDVEKKTIILDKDFINGKVKLTVEVFPTYDLLGWYTIGTSVEERYMPVHRFISAEFNESPLFMLMDANITPETKELPIKIFESVMQVINDIPAMTFVDVDFNIEASEPERITVDIISKQGNGNSSNSNLSLQLLDLKNSVQSLTERMRLIEKYLIMIRENPDKVNYEILHQISAICNSLPIIDSEEFDLEFNNEYLDAHLIAHLASMNKIALSIGETQQKVNDISIEYKKSKRKNRELDPQYE